MEDDTRRRRTSGPSRQLVFDLARDPSYDRDEFLVSSSNESAYATIDRWPAWPSRVLLLVGSPGSGKSHLAAIWAATSDARIVTANHVAISSEWDGPVVALVEDWDRVTYDQASLFHLVNMVGETNGWLMMTSRSVPTTSNITIPDLLSRLRLATVIEVHRPDAELIKSVIIKLFADRQIRIDEEVVNYTALHCERSIDAISGFVAAVDQDALASGRRITRQLAASTMARLALDPGHVSE